MLWRLDISERGLEYPVACEQRETDSTVEILAKGAIAAKFQYLGGRRTDEEAYLTVIKEPVCSGTGEVRDRAATRIQKVGVEENRTF